MKKPTRREREPWFAIRRELSPARQSILTACSFLLPFALWCLISYTPYIWHPNIKLEVGGASGTTIYTAGNHVGKDFFPVFAEKVREENRQLLAAREVGEPPTTSSRANKKILRQIAQIAIDNGLLRDDQREDDAAIFDIWKAIATGRANPDRPALTSENLDFVQTNWETLAAYSETYDSSSFPNEQLLKLIPQGQSSAPIFLPTPGQVWEAGIRDWKKVPEDGKPSMQDLYLDSLKTIFYAFFLAALFAVPLGLLAGTYGFFGKLFEPFTDFFRYMPAPAFAGLLVAIFGIESAPKTALVFIGTFPHLLLMVVKSARLLDRSLIEAAQTLGAKRIGLFSRVVVPGTISIVYNDLRIALGWAWTWLVIAELIGEKSGLTSLIDTQSDRRNFDRVYPAIILIGMTGFFTDQLLSKLRGRIFPWLAEENHRRGPVSRFLQAITDWLEPAIAPHRKAPGNS